MALKGQTLQKMTNILTAHNYHLKPFWPTWWFLNDRLSKNSRELSKNLPGENVA